MVNSAMGRLRCRAVGALIGILLVIAGLSSGLVRPVRAGGLNHSDAANPGEHRARLLVEVDQARRATQDARDAERIAKVDLDNFVNRHFENHRTHIPPLAAETPQKSAAVSAADREWSKINEQLQATIRERDQLLRRFTPVHPEVADAEQRVAQLSDQLSTMDKPSETVETSPDETQAESPALATLPQSPGIEHQQHREFAGKYEQLVGSWQAAHKELLVAVAAEDAAEQRLADFDPTGDTRLQPAQGLPAAPMMAEFQQNGTQPLALAALLIALAVAALAAVRLARSDSVFSSIEDVAAALALPVVGVIPSSASSVAMRRHVSGFFGPRTQRVGEVVLAFIIFTLAVYGAMNPDLVWTLCTDPAEGIRQLSSGR